MDTGTRTHFKTLTLTFTLFHCSTRHSAACSQQGNYSPQAKHDLSQSESKNYAVADSRVSPGIAFGLSAGRSGGYFRTGCSRAKICLTQKGQKMAKGCNETQRYKMQIYANLGNLKTCQDTHPFTSLRLLSTLPSRRDEPWYSLSHF